MKWPLFGDDARPDGRNGRRGDTAGASWIRLWVRFCGFVVSGLSIVAVLGALLVGVIFQTIKRIARL